ncbi:hypothetical protein GOP47_0001569 [Adiantum capillus-veneris]|uniref:J domain-containing protein n=1 Tax=Adiantum capillus-veneris TaxID=13818 RepID=A0A9D4V8H9_ADICA|nr:hypothetical protein GOP47_0001569 [Adiantum capillus-veneris]
MEKPMHTGLPVEINFDDVFGGPPRFAALISASRLGTSQSAMLDKVTARTSSFRTSSLPVFDLPVFGDDASARGVFYDSRASSKVYDDMFDDEGPVPDNVMVSSLHFGSRSKPSSHSSSRRMSPVHTASAASGQLGGAEKLSAKTRPEIGRLLKRGSLSSASSFDESGGKPSDMLLSGVTNDSFLLSVPSSPPRSGSFGHAKSSAGAMDGINIAMLQSFVDSDDVFGGYPQTSFAQVFSVVPTKADSHGGKALGSGKSGLKIFSTSDAHEIPDSVETVLSRSSSTKDGREQRDKQVWTSRRMDSSVSDRSELAAGRTSVTSHDAPSSEPTTPGTPIKVKSWKDLISGPPAGQTFTSRKTGSLVATTKEIVTDKDVADVFVEKHMISQSEQDAGKPCHSSAALQTGKVNSAEYSDEMEERELQALLTNVWKFNEQVEREKYNTKFPVHIAKHPSTQIYLSRTDQYELRDVHEKDSDVSWKEWRKFGRGKISSNESSIDSLPGGFKVQADKDAATLQDTTEDSVGLHTVHVSPDRFTGLKSESEPPKGDVNLVKGQVQGRSDGLRKNASFHGFSSIATQESLYNNEQSRLHMTAQLEDTESLLAFTVGFEEIEGETSERRKLRWERHVRARRRAEKALEELRQREAELQRQENEKQQCSESLDEKIKQWAAGKEGNLRALLSNLQHVLWSDSSWQAIPLSDLIEVLDVKKAYRKATLFVHPDKMQQKGATIQQKYIAEKVYDILQVTSPHAISMKWQ